MSDLGDGEWRRQLASYVWDGIGDLTAIDRGNGANTSYAYDGDDRLSGLTHAFADSAADVAWSFRYDAGNGLLGRGATNDAYTSHGAARSQGYLGNGLNQYASVTTSNYAYDARGNLTSDGTRSFTYDVDNRLLTGSAPTAVTLAYDPTGRLQTLAAGSATTTFLYDGANLAAEYNGGTVLRRYVPSGLGTDMPLIWYEGAAEATPRWLHADNQGSIVAWSDAGGDNGDIMGYDPWGLPDSANGWSGSRFRYTGQIIIPQADLYYYKARVYDPGLGRFLQTDPVGYASDMNAYAYVRNDPIDGIDPFGLDDSCASPCVAPVTVTGQPIPTDPGDTFEVSAAVANLLNSNPEIDPVTVAELVVTARKAPPCPSTAFSGATGVEGKAMDASAAAAQVAEHFEKSATDVAGKIFLPIGIITTAATAAGQTAIDVHGGVPSGKALSANFVGGAVGFGIGYLGSAGGALLFSEDGPPGMVAGAVGGAVVGDVAGDAASDRIRAATYRGVCRVQ